MRIRMSTATLLQLLAFFFLLLPVEHVSAQTPTLETDYCYGGTCYSSLPQAEAAMRAASVYGGLLQPKKSSPSGASGARTLSLHYWVPDRKPETTYAAGYSNGSVGADQGYCQSAGDPLYFHLCDSDVSAADAAYNLQIASFPTCTFQRIGFGGSDAEPFHAIVQYSSTSRYGIIHFNKTYGATSYRYDYTTLCPGWSQPDPRKFPINKQQTFLCPQYYYPVTGYGSLAETPNGTGNIVTAARCTPSQPSTAVITTKLRQSCSKAVNAHPCYPATGDKARFETDFDFAGKAFIRSYHSLRQAGQLPQLAPGWTHSYSDRVIGAVGASELTLITEQGYLEVFTRVGTTSRYASVENAQRVIDVQADNTFKLTGLSGETRAYSTSGRLVHVESSSSGAAIDLTYDGDLLFRVVDNVGRSLTFDYQDNRVSAIHLPGGETVGYAYDATDNFQSVTYADGRTRSYHYNEIGFSDANDPHALTGITAEDGQRYATFGYDNKGRVRLSQLQGASGPVEKTELTYTGDTQVAVLKASGETQTFTLSSASGYRRVTGVAGPGGNASATYSGTYTYETHDEANNVTRFEYSVGNTSQHTRYEAFGTAQERKIVSHRGGDYRSSSDEIYEKSGANYVLRRVLSRTYDIDSNVDSLTVTDPVTGTSRSVQYDYCTRPEMNAGSCPMFLKVMSIDGPRTDVIDKTTFSYYTNSHPDCSIPLANCPYVLGQLKSSTNPLGRTTNYLSYNQYGLPTRIKSANNVVVDLEYANGLLTARKVRGTDDAVETDDQIMRIEYTPTLLVKKMIQPDGAFVSFTYDPAHRLTGIVDNAGNSITYTLNAAGDRTKEDTKDVSGVLQRTLSRTYNALGQLQTVTDAYARNIGFTYDANSNLDTVTDPLTRVSDNNHDPLDRLSRILQDMNGIAAETKFTYDVFDNLTQVNDPKLLNTTYTYNGFSDLKQLSSPDTGTTTYTYDSAGNRASQTDARGKVTNYGYDALNRLTSVAYPATTTLNTTYTYDTAQTACLAGETFTVGRLTKIVDGSGSTVYCYDRFGNLVRKEQTTNAKVFALRYTYNVAGQLTSVIYPDGAVADYLYDTQGRVKEVGAKTATGTRQVLLTSVSYYPFGPASQWTYGTGTSSRLMKRSLNQNYQPGFVEVTTAGGINVGYEFDEVGNLKKLRAANQADPPKRIFGYDGLNRLLDSKDGTTNAVLQAYAYDKTGNRTSATVGATTTTYTYPASSHLLSQVGTNTRAYDFNGNTTSIPSAVVKNFVYGDHNRMTQYKEGATVKMNYVYNGRGEQVRKYVGTTNTYSLYDEAGHWLGDYGNTGAVAPTQQVIWFGDLPVGVLGGAGAAQKLHYIEPDALGTPRVVVDPTRGVNGTAVWTWDLAGEAFGTTAPNQNPDGDANQFVFNMRFGGQRFDSASGMIYNYFRDYEPSTGRYSQSDPVGLAGGTSTYGYVDGNPLAFIDPLGLFNWAKGTAAVLNAMNAGRLAASGMTKFGIGGTLAGTGAGMAPSVGTIAWGTWNLLSARKAYQRGVKQLNEAWCEDTPEFWDGARNLFVGVLPNGDLADDAYEPYWVDVMEGKARNAFNSPGEFFNFLSELGTGGF